MKAADWLIMSGVESVEGNAKLKINAAQCCEMKF